MAEERLQKKIKMAEKIQMAPHAYFYLLGYISVSLLGILKCEPILETSLHNLLMPACRQRVFP
jgi:hypothetical protein